MRSDAWIRSKIRSGSYIHPIRETTARSERPADREVLKEEADFFMAAWMLKEEEITW